MSMAFCFLPETKQKSRLKIITINNSVLKINSITQQYFNIIVNDIFNATNVQSVENSREL